MKVVFIHLIYYRQTLLVSSGLLSTMSTLKQFTCCGTNDVKNKSKENKSIFEKKNLSSLIYSFAIGKM